MKHLAKTIIVATTLAASSAMLSVAIADKGRGGGRTIDIKGRASLLDLVDSSVCIWRTGADVKRETPSFQIIVDSLRETHWYLASLLEREIEALDFCFTKGRLKQIPRWDRYGVGVLENKGDQTGIRFNDLVYMQETTFEALKAEEKKHNPTGKFSHYEFGAGYFLIHEVMHSFISFEAERRDSSIASMVAAIARNQESRMSAKDMGLQIKRNQLEVPPDLTPLGTIRQAIEVAIDTREPERRRTRAAFVAMKAFKANNGLLKLLSPGDKSLITELAEKEQVSRNDEYAAVLSTGTEAEALRVYRAGGRLTYETRPCTDYSGDLSIPIERGFYVLVAEIIRSQEFSTKPMFFEKGPLALKRVGQEALALELLKTKGMIDSKSYLDQISQAIKHDWHEAIELIFQRRPPQDVTYFFMEAIEQDHFGSAIFLFSKYPVRIYNKPIGNKSSVLIRFVQGDFPENLNAALRNGVYEVSDRDASFLTEAVARGDVSVFRRLRQLTLDPGSYSDAPSLIGALNRAIEGNSAEIAQEILYHRGQYVNKRSGFGWTDRAASKAIVEGRLEILRMIVAHPDFNPNIGAESPLITAATLNYSLPIRELLKLGDKISDDVLASAQRAIAKKSGEGKRLIELEIKRRQAKVDAEQAARFQRMN